MSMRCQVGRAGFGMTIHRSASYSRPNSWIRQLLGQRQVARSSIKQRRGGEFWTRQRDSDSSTA